MNLDNIDIGKIYKELILYFCNIDYASCTNYSERNVFIQVKNKEFKIYLEFRLDYPRDKYGEYDYNYIQIAWRLRGYSSFSIPHKFPKDIGQNSIFNIILFEITNWKLKNLDKIVADKVNEVLSSEAITTWLKTKEEQIRMEERAKIENHLSIDEFRKVINEELGKVSINLKIGDKLYE